MPVAGNSPVRSEEMLEVGPSIHRGESCANGRTPRYAIDAGALAIRPGTSMRANHIKLNICVICQAGGEVLAYKESTGARLPKSFYAKVYLVGK